jgi:hypothetical protein
MIFHRRSGQAEAMPRLDVAQRRHVFAREYQGVTGEERAETEGYERVSSFPGLVKSKAHRSRARRVERPSLRARYPEATIGVRNSS